MSARTLQCLFRGVCMPQYFRTISGLVQGWTQMSYTLNVVLYQVLWAVVGLGLGGPEARLKREALR